MKRIVVSVTNDLTTDQRVEKVCNTLFENGFDVLLIGRKLKNSAPIKRKYKTKRFTLIFNSGFLYYAEYNLRLFFYLFFTKKDVLLANDLDTLLANYLISRLQGKKIIIDCHELFPEIPELVNRKKVKNVWLFLEKKLLPKVKYKYTVCDSIANYYQEKHQTNFEVFKNLPRRKELEKGEFRFDTKNKKIILYQGAINVGRGLELLIETMKHLDNHLFIIIGHGDIFQQLQEKVRVEKLEQKIFFLGKMTPESLHKITPLAHLGISIEEDLGLNYRFALPNKIFDYIQAEVPILVSDLPEMKKVVLKYNVGEIVINRNPKELAIQIEMLLEKDFSTELKKAKNELIWENQEEQIIEFFNKIV
ncbi:MAG: glycosyltransferase [Polaribacter sp.]|nr:glycosyltransferase [Polaribacter sp.]